MGLQIPRLSEYNLSPTLGFLSPDPPLSKLPDAYYKPWEDLIVDLPRLISSKSIYDKIKNLPLLTTHKLDHRLQWQRAYLVLAYLVHGYVWARGAENPAPEIPPQLSEPFLKVCEHLGMEAVLSYAGLCLWNWKSEKLDVWTRGGIDDVDCIGNFTGTRDEAVFDLVSDAVEAAGGSLVGLFLEALADAEKGGTSAVMWKLCQAQHIFSQMAVALGKLYKQVDPKVFYQRIRPFLAGGGGLSDGMVFRRENGTVVKVKSVGGSAAQSSLFQYLDIVLGVVHQGSTKELLENMRRYMPGEHRRFLLAMTELPNLGDFVQTHHDNLELNQAYQDCLKALRSWRSKHIAVVSTYIVRPSRGVEEREVVNGEHRTNGEVQGQDEELQGTGGSALIPFLKQSRDETVAQVLRN